MSAQLLVLEYGGTARSGKGTIVEYLSAINPDVAREEAGQYYRAVALDMLEEGIIDPTMSKEVITKQTASADLSDYNGIVADIDSFVGARGTEALHSTEVDSVVGAVSPVEALRKMVKSGVRSRIERIRDQGEHRALLIDGRELHKVVRGIDGARLLMSTFVTCAPSEAARREILGKGLAIDSQEARSLFYDKAKSIAERNRQDSSRPIDAVQHASNAIDYWNDGWIMDSTVQAYADNYFDGDYMYALDQLNNTTGRNMQDVFRIGVGTAAVRTERQILFDTTLFNGPYIDSRLAMLIAADQMFQEALQAT